MTSLLQVEHLKEATDTPVEDIIKLIDDCKGSEDDVIKKLNEKVMEDVLAGVWNDEDTDLPITQETFQEFIRNGEIDREVRYKMVRGNMNACSFI